MARTGAWIAGAVALAALAGCEKKAAQPTAKAPAQAPQTSPPPRKAGLWEQRVSTGDLVQVSRICLDEAADRKLSWWGQQATKDLCARNEVARSPDGGWRFTSVCDMGTGGKVTTVGVASGDFAARYQVRADTSTTGAEAPQMNGHRKMTIDAAWQGPCPAGMKPGDMALPGGVKINLLEVGR